MIAVELRDVASVDDARMGRLAGQLVRVAIEAVAMDRAAAAFGLAMAIVLDVTADDDELPEPIVMACLDGMILKQNLASAGRIDGRSRAENRR